MAKRSYKKVPGYVGIYTRPSLSPALIDGERKPDLSYYARYNQDGKPKFTFLGRRSDKPVGMTPAQAANMRAQLIAEVEVELPKTHRRKSALSDGSADDFDPEKQAPEWWTFDRLWRQYVTSKGGPDSYRSYRTDRGYYNNHLVDVVGPLRPCEITPLKIKTLRNQLRTKPVILTGPAAALEAAKKKRNAALKLVDKKQDPDEKLIHYKDAMAHEKQIRAIEKMIAENKRPLSPAMVEKCLEIVRRLARFGTENRLCAGPDQRIKLKRVDNEKTEDLTPDQIARLIKVCREDAARDVGEMILFALCTGLRRGSIFMLQWRHVNLQKNTITVKASGQDRHSKSGRQIKLPLSPAARRILEQRAAVADLEYSPYVFPGLKGGRRKCAGKAARRICDAAGLPPDFRPFHGQRHAFASNLANSGLVDLYQIGKLLAHSPNSPTMTQRYSHMRDEALRRATGIMSDIVQDAEKASTEEDLEEERRAG